MESREGSVERIVGNKYWKLTVRLPYKRKSLLNQVYKQR